MLFKGLFSGLDLNSLPYDTLTEIIEENGKKILVEKKVLYDKTQTPVTISEKKTIIPEEVSKIENEISRLESKKQELVDLLANE
jgi:uncharacterized protein (DUF2344 family)